MRGNVLTKTALRRLDHVQRHLKHGFDIDACVRNIKSNSGSVPGSLLELASHSLAMAVVKWFVDHDLHSSQQWFYSEALLLKMRLQADPPALVTMAHVWQLLPVLMSNDVRLVDWRVGTGEALVRHAGFYDRRTEFVFRCAYGALANDKAAIHGLVSQVDSWIQQGDAYREDAEFFRHFADGDVSAIATSVLAVANRSQLSDRIDGESGYTEGLISTPACIYALLAHRAGYDVKVEHDLVPIEWIVGKESGSDFDLPYDFLSPE